MVLDDAEKQVLECIAKESAYSQLISVGLQQCIQVIFLVLNSDNKTEISVPAQTVAHEFRGFYVFRLCNGGSIFDIQLGYHMRTCDKGGGTRSTLIWVSWYTRYSGKIQVPDARKIFLLQSLLCRSDLILHFPIAMITFQKDFRFQILT